VRALVAVVALALLAAAPAQAAPALRPVGSFSSPVGVTAPPGDAHRLMVVQQGGTVAMVKDGVTAARPFLDVSAIVDAGSTERGLLSLAFPPDYQQTGLFYVYLTAKDPAGEIQVREYRRADADHADASGGRLVLAIAHAEFANHNGGQLQFGPDGLLWIGTGDGGNRDDTLHNAQDTTRLLGKLLRIDPRAAAGRAYTVPADNPFGNEVWAYGLRNPWRFSFDRATGDLLIGDVGQDHHEEIDYASRAGGLGRGVNYGWPCREGLADNAAVSCVASGTVVDPIVDQSHADGWAAIIGGYVVRDPGLPTLAGRYLYGDFAQSATRAVGPAAPAGDAPAGVSLSSLSAFGEDACGRLYTASLDGPVSAIVDGSPSPCSFPEPPAAGGSVPVPADATPCALSVRTTGTRRVAARRWLGLRVRSSEACRLTVTGRISGVARFRTLRRAIPAARTTTLRLRIGRSGARSLRRALRRHRVVHVRLRVRGLDAVGNERVISRRARLRR
jgi:glucose/arabinose dehydrogenase